MCRLDFVFSRHFLGIAGLLAVVGMPAAVAQNNSLFAGAPASPQGTSAAVSEAVALEERSEATQGTRPVPLTNVSRRAAVAQSAAAIPATVQNPTLLAMSPIAVPAPEPRVFSVHDQITIIVRYTINTSAEATSETERTWEIDSTLARFIRLDGMSNLIPQTFEEGAPGIDFDFENTYEGEGETESQRSVTTRVQASIIDVKPNGLLVIEAKSRVKVDEDEQITTLTGTCRSEDITAQNTVLSSQVANLNLEVQSTGINRDATRRGWLARAFDWLRPL